MSINRHNFNTALLKKQALVSYLLPDEVLITENDTRTVAGYKEYTIPESIQTPYYLFLQY